MSETYRTKKVNVVDAILWDGTNYKEVKKLAPEVTLDHDANELVIETEDNTMFAKVGDYVIRRQTGEVFPCPAASFEEAYSKTVPLNHRHW